MVSASTLIILISVPFLVAAQNLTAVYVDPLPYSWYNLAAYFNGSSDSIFTFGGFNTATGEKGEILRFDIATGTNTLVGHMPGYLSDISVQGDSSSSIYLFGWGGSTSNIIYKCNPLINVTAYVGQIPLVPRYSITTTLRKAEDSEEILIFEGQSHYHRVASFNMSTLIATEKGSLVPGLRSATSVRVGGKAYLFGIAAPHNSAFQVLDLETLEGPVFDVGFFPFNHAPEVVYNGENIYILGGNRGPPSRGILQLDPNSHEWRLVPVDNFQLQDEDYYYDVAPVPIYVEKLGRIYFFGGKVMNR